MGKRKERRKTVEPIESLLPSSSSTTETTKRKRRRTDGGGGGGTRWKDLKSMDGGDDDPDVAAMVTKILVESKKKEASSLDVEEVELTVENKDRRPFDYSIKATKYCKVCKKGLHYTFETLFEHYQDHHHAILKSFHYYGYIGKRLIGKKNVLERDFCQRCSIKFHRPRDYFSHMIRNHIEYTKDYKKPATNDLNKPKRLLHFEMADNADVEARMLFRDRIITLGYNFKFGESSGRTTPYNDAPPPLDPSTDSFGDSDVPTTSSGIQMIKKEEPMEPMEMEKNGEEEPMLLSSNS
uniref:C2H2-type domain-containing protein n=1 Tax=Caenorhabditis tropicalis TaxID=1561998 RepID=A0A1I7UD19_9PELO